MKRWELVNLRHGYSAEDKTGLVWIMPAQGVTQKSLRRSFLGMDAEIEDFQGSGWKVTLPGPPGTGRKAYWQLVELLCAAGWEPFAAHEDHGHSFRRKR